MGLKMGFVAPLPEHIGTPTMLFCVRGPEAHIEIFHLEIWVKSTVLTWPPGGLR